jgi:hypothetical protein
MLKNKCLVCQFNKTNANSHMMKPWNFKKAPQMWRSIDLIPNMPKMKNDYSAILLAVDSFKE